MKRILSIALLGIAAATAMPAQATEGYVVDPVVSTDGGVFVGARYSRDSGRTYQPIGGAGVSTETGQACVGLSYQIPFCTPVVK